MPYLTIKQTKIHSKHGGFVTRIDLVGVKDRKLYHTYIDSGNYNYRHWRYIVENPDYTYILNNLHIKEDNLISADCPPEIERATSNPDDLLNSIAVFWAEEDRRLQASTLNELLRIGK